MTTEPLTADDVAALREADQVGFHYFEGKSYLVAYFRGNRPATARLWNLFPTQEHGTERSRKIDTDARVRGYNERTDTDWTTWTADPDDHAVTCFHLQYGGRSDETWQTIAGLLRAGDTLALHWEADDNSSNIRAAELHSDTLHLRVTSPKGKARMFLVVRNVSPDNSARMIRRYGNQPSYTLNV